MSLELLTNLNAERIGNLLGKLIEVDRVSIFGMALRRYIRIRVKLRVEEPLPKSFDLPRPNRETKKIHIKYEKLFNFCYGCRRLGHTMQACPNYDTNPEIMQFGPWMRAENPLNRRNNGFDL